MLRTLCEDEFEWRVYEISAVSNARASRCLIFDSDSVVRRCWSYPPNWLELSDEELWHLLQSQSALRAPGASHEHTVDAPLDPTLSAAADMTAAAHILASEVQVALEANRALSGRRDQLLASCRKSRDTMMKAVDLYAASLKHAGTPPEQAIILIKDAMRCGLGGESRRDEPEEAKRFGEGVTSGIKAYYGT